MNALRREGNSEPVCLGTGMEVPARIIMLASLWMVVATCVSSIYSLWGKCRWLFHGNIVHVFSFGNYVCAGIAYTYVIALT